MKRPLTKTILFIFLLAPCCDSFAAHSVSIGLLAEGTRWETPTYFVDSGASGPTVLIVGGVHGNEPAGFRSVEQIRHWPIVKGRLVVIPAANVPGLEANTRFLPGESADVRDLNRNFPDDDLEKGALGDVAQSIWPFVHSHRPDWVIDLHEGYEFNISHKPGKGETKSVGSSVIYESSRDLDPIAEGMRDAADALVTRPDRRFNLLKSGARRTSLVGACVNHLGAKGMILETTFNDQPLSLRTREHRAMVNVLLRHLGMIDRDCVDVLVAREEDEMILVGLYDGPGATDRGIARLRRAIESAPDMSLRHLGPTDMRPAVLNQFDVIAFPGGGGSSQAKAIGEEGRDHVRAFVRQGGGFLGVCAGAFLASSHYSWSFDLLPTTVLTGAVKVEGRSRQMWYRGDATTVSVQLSDDGRQLFSGIPEVVDVTYQNGPILSPKQGTDLPPYTTLATYRSEQVRIEPQRGTMVNTPAIVSGLFHKGRVIAIGPHPEATEALYPIITQSIRWGAKQTNATWFAR